MKTTFLLCLTILAYSINAIAQKIEIVQENETYFLIDKSGSKPKKTEYSFIYPCSFSKDYVIAEKDKLFFINLATGKTIELDETFDNIRLSNDTVLIEANQLLRFKEKSKTGLLKVPDKIVLNAEYTNICPKAENPNFFLLLKGKNWQFYYPKTGKFSVSFQVNSSSDLYLDNGLSYLPDETAFLAKVEDNLHIMKSDGTDYILNKSYSKTKDLNLSGMTMISCTKDGKYGYVDENANIQIEFKYDWAEPMEGNAIVKYQGKYGLLRDNGTQLIPFVYDMLTRKSPELFNATKDGKELLILENGDPYDQLMVMEENNKYIFATEDKSIKMEGSFDAAQQFKNGLAPVKNNGKWAYIIPSGFVAIPYQFDDAKQFNSNMVAAVKLNNKWGLIDLSGKFICEAQFDSIDAQDENVIKLTNKYGVYEFGYDKKLKLIQINPEKGNFTDPRDGMEYKTIKLGQQIWFAQNLNYKTEESWWFQNNEVNGNTNGRLYTWKAALKACPIGWHLPSDDDWKVLEKTLGMPADELNSTDYKRGPAQAAMLQISGSTGFDIQMSGFLHGYDNNFYKMGEVCTTWTSTPNGTDYAFSRSFYPKADLLGRDNNTYVKYGLPVRCLKD